MCGAKQYDDLQPLSYCASLRSLEFTTMLNVDVSLPGQFHTSEDLRQRLPNVTSLELSNLSSTTKEEVFSQCVDVMTQAWGSQLTKLHLWQPRQRRQSASKMLQLCTCLHILELRYSEPVTTSLANSPTSLRKLVSADYLPESDLEPMLQLPLLQEVQVYGFSNGLKRDWSHHPCKWRQLKSTQVSMVDLPKLPLHSLEGEACFNVTTVWIVDTVPFRPGDNDNLHLPDPLLPTSLAAVTRAVECVSNAMMTINGFEAWTSNFWKKSSTSPQNDAALAELLRVASKVVYPPAKYKLWEDQVSQFPQTASALIRWLSPNLQKLDIYGCMEPLQPWWWQLLQCCIQLCEVQVCPPDEETASFMDLVSSTTLAAAQHLVAAIKRPLMMLFICFKAHTLPSLDQDTLATKTRLQKDLPEGVSLQHFAWEHGYKLNINLVPSTSSQEHQHRVEEA